MSIDFGVDIGQKRLNFNTGYMAKQADGSVLVSCGETVVFASAVVSKEVKEDQDFFPLMVDYREKSYAAGKIPGGFLKRESRPSDRETLVCRLTDRPIRPLFPKGFVNEVQIIIYVLSADKENQPDILAINAASAALSVSGMPFKGPVGAVRVGRLNGEWLVNPSYLELEESNIDLVVAGTKKAITMIEGSSKNVSEEDMLQAVEFAHENIKKICEAQEEFAKLASKPLMPVTLFEEDESLKARIKQDYYSSLEGLKDFTIKKEREQAFNAIVEKAEQELAEEYPEKLNQVKKIIDDFDGEIVRQRILDEGARADGRRLDEIRPIDIKVGILPRAHGSAIFTRGETQSLGITTLGSPSDAQRLDQLEGDGEKKFMLHYAFPPFSVGETGRTGGAGRREIGHGMLAERSLEYVLPSEDDFPYVIRQNSEVMESNGSSSMATVCSGSLAMFNAGVPLKGAVAGIAMGLVMEGEKYAVLSDIQGLEDHLGDMDFKVAGTNSGITAFQLDIKIEGITLEIMKVALEQARQGRLSILEEMDKVISKPGSLSDYAPKMKIIKINPEKIGEVIGPGGKVIRKMIEETGADISVENDGSITISAVEDTSISKAEEKILGITAEPEIGKIYKAIIKKIVDFGAFCEFLPGKEGLCHISNLAFERVNKVEDLFKEGDEIEVKILNIDRQGKVSLSRKETLKK